METEQLIFISGGVRSGKSSFAETMAADLSKKQGTILHYIACGVASDEEMAARITRHRKDRENASVDWSTWECPDHLQRIANHFSKHDILVLDCVTTLLNNYLFDGNMSDPEHVINVILTDLISLRETSATLIVVSNEVTQGVPFEQPSIRNYQYILGNAHQHIVDQADTAYLVENGMPICKKGAVP
ncbi:adenosylcobinamide kinase /adenosylcobinamide-phosphate guanylyltransferase [Lentibacillus persicus]|uniref:Adenosylcobinamide kinase n=1 Tax=Lentibacillus persicus TaxID=640948 RepID=A0A1I1SA31_9BACI|nr:bifunctional adenosylcobinamide kinase/adenosylcobinamide-phosphate guanylyltransferase [Lentibacillus persicus]SFD40723.1 adenosylcobinamide kinase /adenosylcobinamide-phosphate guanylyltransferase [Lentibacillus persicus]